MAGEAKKIAEIIYDFLPESGYDFIDINMGCPMPKIVNNGEGSALMKEPELVEKIVSAMVQEVDIPVTVKMRAGFDDEHINAVEVAKAAEAGGASAVTVHARTREQYYSGKADWTIIKKVKEEINIPVIGNGDIRNTADVVRMKIMTGCDSFMIARAAKGYPWIFAEIKENLGEDLAKLAVDEYELTRFLDDLEVSPKTKTVSVEEKKEMMLKHIELMMHLKGEYIGVREMRKHIAWYTEGIPGAAAIRRRVCQTETENALRALIAEI